MAGGILRAVTSCGCVRKLTCHCRFHLQPSSGDSWPRAPRRHPISYPELNGRSSRRRLMKLICMGKWRRTAFQNMAPIYPSDTHPRRFGRETGKRLTCALCRYPRSPETILLTSRVDRADRGERPVIRHGARLGELTTVSKSLRLKKEAGVCWAGKGSHSWNLKDWT
ncbi:uncharacterized protein EI90DRAFT_3107762 [Cantharellus anzutake]|uniref:uncharacterized protein n=1 Tax=Cantharellus anzutake TaxID=1750568 RepID=UPI0019038F33|nr:uncharacterized protein EI90DRAFT_3107762 [Cantharellus anzutake]KAF8308787.1 hypothetical protein EI90DRAFT_3107762 [Cantharellus anzutake]